MSNLYASNFSTNLPSSFLVSLYPAQDSTGAITNKLYVANTKLQTAASNYLIMPAGALTIMYATGSSNLTDWQISEQWTMYNPGVTKMSVSGLSTSITTQIANSGITNTGYISGAGPSVQDPNGFKVVRLFYNIYSSMI